MSEFFQCKTTQFPNIQKYSTEAYHSWKIVESYSRLKLGLRTWGRIRDNIDLKTATCTSKLIKTQFMISNFKVQWEYIVRLQVFLSQAIYKFILDSIPFLRTSKDNK